MHLGCQQITNNKKDFRKQFHNQGGLFFKRTFYESRGKESAILTERTFKIENEDTIPHGYARSYYENGQIMGEEHYLLGKKHGLERQFYSNGKIKHKGWYVNGELDSMAISYYENNQMESSVVFKKGKKIGQQVTYYPNGKIKEYLMHNPLGELFFQREFNKDGVLLNEKGTMATMLSYTGDDNIFEIGEKLIVKIFVPTPPYFEVNLLVSIKDKEGNAVTNNKPKTLKNGLMTYKTELKQVGSYYFETTIYFNDLAKAEQEVYSHGFEFHVTD